jgi:hypothetical protein
MRYLAVALLSIVVLSGCATTTPRISHVHVGHAITGWVDTPEQRGLFVTAEEEARVIADQATLATDSDSLEQVKQHARGIIHAIDPERQPTGPGTGYGFHKAITGANDHIQYAAQSSDTSANIKEGAERYAVNQAIVVERGELILALAEAIVNTDTPQESRALARETRQLAVHNLMGTDEDGDGVIGSTPREYGLRQLRADLVAMAEREEPPYRAVSQRYLFGLIRLPDGTWSFKDPDKAGGYYVD